MTMRGLREGRATMKGQGRTPALVALAIAVIVLVVGLAALFSRRAPDVAQPPPPATAPSLSPVAPSEPDPTSQTAGDPSLTMSSPADGTPADGTPPDGTPADGSATAGPAPAYARVRCPAPSVTVHDSAELSTALASARPGDVIEVSPGTYPGEFRLAASGTRQQPIWLCGTPAGILDGGNVRGGYVLHLDKASYVRVVGLAIRNGQKGVMADTVSHSVLQDLRVEHIGDEGIHLRRGSSDNLVIANAVADTGLRRDKFGEGIYVGSAKSNWCEISGCEPDRSDRNVIAENVLGPTTSENIDVKEGTTGGFLLRNRLDGSGVTAADSVVDVKGRAWLIEGNTVSAAPADAFQTHEIIPGWGAGNRFSGNSVASRAPGASGGYVVALANAPDNIVTCDNAGPSGMDITKAGCR